MVNSCFICHFATYLPLCNHLITKWFCNSGRNGNTFKNFLERNPFRHTLNFFPFNP